MKTYKITNTDLAVCRIAFGTWHIGGDWDNIPPTQAIKDRADSVKADDVSLDRVEWYSLLAAARGQARRSLSAAGCRHS